MSPPPPAASFNPEDVGPEVKQAGIAGILGMMGMAVRIIMADEHLGWKKAILHLFLAVVVSILTGFVAVNYIEKPTLLWAVNGVSGFMALKIAMFVEAMVEAKMAGKLNEARRAAGIKKPKPNGKRRKAAAKR
jgi:hypothetical protein